MSTKVPAFSGARGGLLLFALGLAIQLGTGLCWGGHMPEPYPPGGRTCTCNAEACTKDTLVSVESTSALHSP